MIILRLLPAFALLACAAPPSVRGQEELIRVFARNAVPGIAAFECPCEFDLGSEVDGETVLVIDHNGERQPAFANVDGSVVRAEGAEPFRFGCHKGERVEGAWRSGGIDLGVALTVESRGEEACWFRGTLSVASGDRAESRPVVGACGC